MKKIGITGGIGSGKSTVCKVFEVLNIPVYDADTRAKWLMNYSPNIKSRIIEAFGDESYTEEGLNRTYLAQLVFNNVEHTKTINSIVHPEVGNDFKVWVESQNTAYVIKEAALMFESSSYKEMDEIICVTAPLEVRISRTLNRDKHRDRKQVEGIINKQMPQEEKVAKSDYEIKNDDDNLLIPQVLKIHESLVS